jgi:formate dehydrogenase major subunit
MIRDYGKRVTVRAQGEAVEAREGEWALEALLRTGFDIPHVCYHESLGPIQTCDTCLVEVGGELVRSCALPVAEGLELRPDTPRAVAARAEATQRLLATHDLYCTICDNNNGDCTLHNAVHKAGLTHQRYPFAPKPYPVDDSNPFYRYDPDQCILCGRCVEACQNVQVNETLTIDWESEAPRVLWDGGRAVNDSSCVSCGHCVTVCPCNALMEKTMLGEAGHFTRMLPVLRSPATAFVKSLEAHTGLGPVFALSDAEAALREGDIRKTKTVCTYCGVGCSFDVWTKGRTLLKVQPRAEAPANGISTCIKGKFGWDFVTSPERLTQPLIRDGERFREASWDEALALVARRLSDIKERHGPDSLGFIGSSKCSNEESYLIQKLARGVVGTNNVDNCSRYCQSPATVGLWRTVGLGGDAGSIHDIERAGLVLVIGSNTAESHPVLATRVKRAQKLRGQTLIVADLRKHEMAERADVFLKPRPGTDLVWLSALARYILDSGLADEAFLRERVSGLEAYRESLEPFTLAYAEETTGIPASTLKDVAERIAAADGVCALWAMGVTQHTGGSDASTAISNLLLVTGNYGRPGAGAYPLRGHNNVQGTSDFGSITTFLPGYQPVSDASVREKFGAAWGVTLPETPGLNNHQMVGAIHDGRLRGLYIMGEDMAVVDANANHVQAAFEKLEFLVVQELFFSTTASFADVVLPAAASLEKDGTFTNTERRVQRFYAAMPPYAECRPDWQILQDVARALGQDWGYQHPSEIMAEAASLTPLFAGVSYERLGGYSSLQWPVDADGADTPLLYETAFAFPDGRARLYPLPWIEPGEQPDADFDLHLNNGRVLEHFHAGNMTYRSPGIAAKVPDTFVEVSLELAAERGLDSGDLVRLVSRRGAVRVRVLVTERVSGRELYMPMNSSSEAVNRLTGDAVDRASDTPAYKELAVRLEKLGPKGASPLPRHNPRFGEPTPQAGVEVERKWARSDYRLPGGD